jgi:hypothetical protein
MVALGRCYIHGGLFEFDPLTVVSVLIDPVTSRPPDVGADGQPCEPDPAAVERSVKRPICDPCITRVNQRKGAEGKDVVQLAADRREFGEWPQ